MFGTGRKPNSRNIGLEVCPEQPCKANSVQERDIEAAKGTRHQGRCFVLFVTGSEDSHNMLSSMQAMQAKSCQNASLDGDRQEPEFHQVFPTLQAVSSCIA